MCMGKIPFKQIVMPKMAGKCAGPECHPKTTGNLAGYEWNISTESNNVN